MLFYLMLDKVHLKQIAKMTPYTRKSYHIEIRKRNMYLKIAHCNKDADLYPNKMQIKKANNGETILTKKHNITGEKLFNLNNYHSIVQTCILIKVNPYEYLGYILDKLANITINKNSNIEELLPWNCVLD